MRCTKVKKSRNIKPLDVDISPVVSRSCALKLKRRTELCVLFSYFQKSLIVTVTWNHQCCIETTYFTFASFFVCSFFFTKRSYHIFKKLSSKKRNAYLFILCLNTFYFFTVEMLKITCLCRRACMSFYCTLTHSYIFKWDYKYTISRHLVLILLLFLLIILFFIFYFQYELVLISDNVVIYFLFAFFPFILTFVSPYQH